MSVTETAAAEAAGQPSDPIPLFDPRAQYQRLKRDIDARVAAVMAHGAYINGPEVGEFEAALADWTGAAACVACANGTDALVMSLLAHDVGPGDAVFVPAFTYVATAGAVRLAGATPVFCDVLEATANLDPDDLVRQVARVRKALGTRAVGHAGTLDPNGEDERVERRPGHLGEPDSDGTDRRGDEHREDERGQGNECPFHRRRADEPFERHLQPRPDQNPCQPSPDRTAPR